ncbi:hypothetical protein Pcac1_g11858 [Phytophthora cactorum]|nr:hypothetical protein Pcac1_g11858 [Phytophthora cactorum]
MPFTSFAGTATRSSSTTLPPPFTLAPPSTLAPSPSLASSPSELLDSAPDKRRWNAPTTCSRSDGSYCSSASDWESLSEPNIASMVLVDSAMDVSIYDAVTGSSTGTTSSPLTSSSLSPLSSTISPESMAKVTTAFSPTNVILIRNGSLYPHTHYAPVNDTPVGGVYVHSFSSPPPEGRFDVHPTERS